MELFIIWLLCGVVAAVVAANKGRNVFGWLVLGFLLGPFGMILSFVVSKNQATVEHQAVESGTMRKCPFCAEIIKRDAIKCRFCSSELPPYEEPGVVTCHNCGKRIKPRPKDTTCYLCSGYLNLPSRS